MRTAYAIGLSVAAGALVFACAKGDAGTVAGSSGDDGELDAGTSSGEDGSVNYNGDSGVKDGGGEGGIVDAGPKCDDDDAGCVVSGAVGLCAVGTHHCDDAGASVCTSDVTTQACYSGVASTRNLGECHDGTQSCLGTAPGTCAGEALPAAHENCFNNLDDDCDGLINDGCPSTLTLGADQLLSIRGGTGGGAVSVHCPKNALVTRVDGYFDGSDQKVSGVAIYCATPTLVQGATSYSVTLTPNTPAPYQKQVGSASNAVARTDDCGLTGLTSMRYMVGKYDSWVEGLGNHCGTSTVTLGANNAINFSFTDDTSTEFTGYSPFPGTFAEDDCATNQVVVGFNMRHGAYMDQIQAVCAPLVVTYLAGTPDP